MLYRNKEHLETSKLSSRLLRKSSSFVRNSVKLILFSTLPHLSKMKSFSDDPKRVILLLLSVCMWSRSFVSVYV